MVSAVVMVALQVDEGHPWLAFFWFLIAMSAGWLAVVRVRGRRRPNEPDRA